MVAQLVNKNKADKLSIFFISYPLPSIVRAEKGYVKKFSLADVLGLGFLQETIYRTKVVR